MNYNELNKIICNFLNNPESKMYLETMENVKNSIDGVKVGEKYAK